MSVYITQLIYVKEGKESIFQQFEDFAIPLISKYNGQLLLRTRPTKHQFIEGSLFPPYEIHLVAFNSETDFQNFMKDDERKKFMHLKEQSIESVFLIQGIKI